MLVPDVGLRIASVLRSHVDTHCPIVGPDKYISESPLRLMMV